MVIVGTLWEDETRFFFLRDWAISNDCASIIVRLRLQGVLNGDLRGSDCKTRRSHHLKKKCKKKMTKQIGISRHS